MQQPCVHECAREHEGSSVRRVTLGAVSCTLNGYEPCVNVVVAGAFQEELQALGGATVGCGVDAGPVDGRVCGCGKGAQHFTGQAPTSVATRGAQAGCVSGADGRPGAGSGRPICCTGTLAQLLSQPLGCIKQVCQARGLGVGAGVVGHTKAISVLNDEKG